MDSDPRFRGRRNQRNILLELASDPFVMWKDDQKANAVPIGVRILNLPPHLRNRVGVGCHFFTLDYGSTKGRTHLQQDKRTRNSIDSLMEMVVDELDWLCRVGVKVQDASKGLNAEEETLYVKLVFVLSDLRGLQDMMKCSVTPAYYGCLKCWLKSSGKANGKAAQLFQLIMFFLSNHNMRLTDVCSQREDDLQ